MFEITNLNQFTLLSTYLLSINKSNQSVPTKVAVQYSHRSANTPDNRDGVNERAGFMDAPDIKAKNKISSPTIPPIAIPLNPFKPFV